MADEDDMPEAPHILAQLDRPAISLNRFDTLIPVQTALIVIDLQAAFLSPDMPAFVPSACATVAPSNRLARVLRASGGQVAFTRHTIIDEGRQALPKWQAEDADLYALFATMKSGSAGHALVPELEIHADDWVLDKYRYSAFMEISSSIDEQLRERAIDTVIITGTVTNICCESSARDAHMLGYRVFFVADATAAMTDEAHNATLRSMAECFADVRSTDELSTMIERSRT